MSQDPMLTRAALALALHAGEDLTPIATVRIVLAGVREPSDDLVHVIQNIMGPFEENAKAMWHGCIDHLLEGGQ